MVVSLRTPCHKCQLDKNVKLINKHHNASQSVKALLSQLAFPTLPARSWKLNSLKYSATRQHYRTHSWQSPQTSQQPRRWRPTRWWRPVELLDFHSQKCRSIIEQGHAEQGAWTLVADFQAHNGGTSRLSTACLTLTSQVHVNGATAISITRMVCRRPVMLDMRTSCSNSETWPTDALLQKVRENVVCMTQIDGDSVRFAVSPYRICPLGAHIDHQGGSVTAMAINKGVILGFVPSKTTELKLRSGQYTGQVNFSISDVQARKSSNDLNNLHLANDSEEAGWGNYARGAVQALRISGYHVAQGIVGFVDGSKGCDGGGISSSAAVGVAFLLALEAANSLVLSEEENIELDRLIENSYLGLRNGLLDQSAILLSQRNCLTVINCKDRKHDIVPPPWNDVKASLPYKIVLAFSGLRHALASKPGYNTRVDECQAAASALLRALGRTSAEPLLGNVTAEEYTSYKCVLEGSLAKRARHYFTESSRVQAGIKAWTGGDLITFGKLMSESGLSSIEDYECGCDPLVQLREIVLQAPGVLGARFSGAGFRGCCVGLVLAHLADEAALFIREEYRKAHPELAKHLDDDTAVLVCDSADKAHILL